MMCFYSILSLLIIVNVIIGSNALAESAPKTINSNLEPPLGLKWKFFTNCIITTSPVVTKNTVYLTTIGGKIFAIDRETGNCKWSYNIKEAIPFPPIVKGEKLYIRTEMGVYILDANSGSFLEETNVFPSTGLPHFRLQTKVRDIAYKTWRNKVYAILTPSRIILWEYSTKGIIEAPLLLDKDMLFVSSRDGTLYAFGSAPKDMEYLFRLSKARGYTVGFEQGVKKGRYHGRILKAWKGFAVSGIILLFLILLFGD
jgi:hypothetical protein